MGKMSEEQVRELRELAADGWSLAELAERFGVAVSYISMVARGERLRGVARDAPVAAVRSRRFTEQDLREMAEMRADGESWGEIAVEFGASRQGVAAAVGRWRERGGKVGRAHNGPVVGAERGIRIGRGRVRS